MHKIGNQSSCQRGLSVARFPSGNLDFLGIFRCSRASCLQCTQNTVTHELRGLVVRDILGFSLNCPPFIVYLRSSQSACHQFSNHKCPLGAVFQYPVTPLLVAHCTKFAPVFGANLGLLLGSVYYFSDSGSYPAMSVRAISQELVRT